MVRQSSTNQHRCIFFNSTLTSSACSRESAVMVEIVAECLLMSSS